MHCIGTQVNAARPLHAAEIGVDGDGVENPGVQQLQKYAAAPFRLNAKNASQAVVEGDFQPVLRQRFGGNNPNHVLTFCQPKNAACTAFIAFSPMARSMMTEILISLVEIMPMFTPSLASTSNIFPATPVWLFMPTPTMESLPIFSSARTSLKPISALRPSMTLRALSKSGLSAVNERSVAGVPAPWLMFWTIMSTLTVASPSALKMRAATPGLSGTATRVILA